MQLSDNKYMKYFVLLILSLFALVCKAQANGDYIGNLSYSKAKVQDVSAPKNLIKLGQDAENRYIENRSYTNDLEIVIIKLLKKDIRPELKIILESSIQELSKIRKDNSFADSTLKLIEITENIEKGLALYYED